MKASFQGKQQSPQTPYGQVMGDILRYSTKDVSKDCYEIIVRKALENLENERNHPEDTDEDDLYPFPSSYETIRKVCLASMSAMMCYNLFQQHGQDVVTEVWRYTFSYYFFIERGYSSNDDFADEIAELNEYFNASYKTIADYLKIHSDGSFFHNLATYIVRQSHKLSTNQSYYIFSFYTVGEVGIHIGAWFKETTTLIAQAEKEWLASNNVSAPYASV